MSNQREITIELDAICIYHYLLKYSKLEEIIKQLYIKSWPYFKEETKQRIMYYQGGLSLESGFIEYDSYSIVTQHHKFDTTVLLNKLTLNQIIKIERKENQINTLNFEIPSLQNKKMVYLSQDCILKLLNMRNILAHQMVDLSFKNKDYIDVLNNETINGSDLQWLKSYDLNMLSESARYIVSNYIYMNMIYQRLRGEQDDIKTMDNGKCTRFQY